MFVFEKLDFLCKHENTLKDFLEFFFIINQDLWCIDGKDHSFEWCNGAHADIKFLMPVMEKTQKNISFEEKNASS